MERRTLLGSLVAAVGGLFAFGESKLQALDATLPMTVKKPLIADNTTHYYGKLPETVMLEPGTTAVLSSEAWFQAKFIFGGVGCVWDYVNNVYQCERRVHCRITSPDLPRLAQLVRDYYSLDPLPYYLSKVYVNELSERIKMNGEVEFGYFTAKSKPVFEKLTGLTVPSSGEDQETLKRIYDRVHS